MSAGRCCTCGYWKVFERYRRLVYLNDTPYRRSYVRGIWELGHESGSRWIAACT